MNKAFQLTQKSTSTSLFKFQTPQSSLVLSFPGSLLSILVELSGIFHTRDESSQSELRDMQTCETTLALAYVLCYLSTT